jgi:hypothetical protein
MLIYISESLNHSAVSVSVDQDTVTLIYSGDTQRLEQCLATKENRQRALGQSPS